MADDQSTNPQDQTQQPDPAQQPDAQPPAEAKPSEEPKTKRSGRRGGSLEDELAELEERRAELKRTPKDKLDGDEFAEVKTRIAEIKAELGIQ